MKPLMMNAAIAAFLSATSLSTLGQTTGWVQTGAGPYDYTNTANWVGGAVNGIWDASLLLAAHQTTRFHADTVLSSGLKFLYDGGYNETLRSESTAGKTLTLGGDITVNTVSANRTVTIGSTTAGQKLNVQLGGVTRRFDVRAAPGSQRSLTLINPISDGAIISQGGGNINFSSGSAITNTFSSITLKNAHLGVGDYSDVNVSGPLVIDGIGGVNGDANAGGISILTLYNGKARFHPMTAASLVRTNNGVALFRGANLGAPAGNYVCNLTFNTPPTAQLVGGGGAAGTTNISIIAWALGGTTFGAFDTFVTYDTYGIRPLNPTTEFVTNITVGTISANNVMLSVASGTTTNDFDTTINSLYMPGSATLATMITGTGTLTVASGAVYLGAVNATTKIDAKLNFGNRQGVIGYGMGKSTEINGAISGSAGLILYQPAPYAGRWSSGAGIIIGGNSANSTYSGDTHIYGRVSLPNGFLPSGSRTGDVFAWGLASYATAYSINGLNGSGEFGRTQSGAASTLSLGGNNANGDFDGVIYDNGPLAVLKIGSGTQRLGGVCSYDGATTVNGGTLIVDGTIISATTVQTNATLRGKGTISKSGTAITVQNGGRLAPGGSDGIGTMTVLQGGAAFAKGSFMEVTVGKNGCSAITIAGSVTGNYIIPVAVHGEGAGKWLIMQAASIAPDFRSATPGVRLTPENGGTEVWAERLNKTTVIMLR